jgi:hypothetical protein
MRSLSFKKFYEATDLFGFERDRPVPEGDAPPSSPVSQFDVEELMALLTRKKLGMFEGSCPFPNVAQWGSRPGSVKLEVDPGYRFSIKKLGIDKLGNPRWVTRKMFQLNRTGYGGYEDAVAQEIFEHLQRAADGMIEAAPEDYKDLERLAHNVYEKVKKTAKEIFFPEGIRKVHDDAYIIKFGVRASGVEARNHQRVEQNQIMLAYDREQGTIRMTNYNLLSAVGGSRDFKIGLNELDAYFFPSQERDEISEVIATRMKYY